MENLTARPRMLKQLNLSSLRKAIKNRGTATRAEIAWETRISSTTVRSLLLEMQRNGEVESVGYDTSRGGRKAERYRLKRDRYHGLALCLTDSAVHHLTVDIYGEIVDSGRLDISGTNNREALARFLDAFLPGKAIKSIGVGVPGIVEGGGYLRMNRENELIREDIGDFLARRYALPVVLENDLNAITIGFSCGYGERGEDLTVAFIHFESDCISAGFIAGGRIIRGWNNFAGELGLIPMEGRKPLAQCVAEAADDAAYTARISEIIGWVCAVLNPKCIALGGPDFRSACFDSIANSAQSLLPRGMAAEILFSRDVWQDYYRGMAFLTASRIFDDVQLVKE